MAVQPEFGICDECGYYSQSLVFLEREWWCNWCVKHKVIRPFRKNA